MKKIPILVLVVMLISGGMYASQLRIAVTPFDNTAGSDEFAFLTDGFAEALTFGLCQLKDIQIVERQGIDRIMEEYELGLTGLIDADEAAEIGKMVGANYLMTGSYQVIRDNIRVYCRLVDVAKGVVDSNHSFAATGNVDTVFDLQDDLINQVVASFSIEVAPEEKERIETVSRDLADNLEAFEYYLLGRNAFFRVTPEYYEQAIAYYRRALELKPDYALAWAGLSSAYLFWGYERSWNGQSYTEFYDEAIAAANKAVELAGNLSETYTAVALVYAYWLPSPRHEETWKYAQHAIELNPNNGEAYFAVGRAYKNEEYLLKAIELNPNYILVYNKLGLLYEEEGRLDEAIAMHETAVRLNPSWAVEWANLAYDYYLTGLYDQALEAINRAIELQPDLEPAYSIRSLIQKALARRKE